MTDTQQRAAAKAFAKNWKDRGYEKGDSQIFWVELLTTVFGVTEISQFISFEDQVHLDHTSFIDGYIEKTHVMIEQKSINKSLTAAIRQSDGSMLTPFEQAKRYSSELPYSKRPRWIVTSNFQSFYIYDMEKPGGDPEIIRLEDLEKEYYRLQFLVDEGNTNLQREMEVSIAAGEIVGLSYDALAKQYVTICFYGIFFICGYNAISAILRGYGDSRRPMYCVALSCILNIIGDFVFVKYLHMGVAGTALATVLSQAVSMIVSIIYLNKKKFLFTFTLSNMRIDKGRLKDLACVGIPISFQESMVRLSFLYLTSVINRLGVSTAAAVGIASKYDVFAMLPATSIASALAVITAQNYGAGKLERAKKSLAAGIGFAILASSVFFLWAQISPQTMIGIFNRDPDIIRAGIPFFRACSYDYLAVSFVFCLNGYMNGRAKTVFTMISCCFGALVLRMPLIWLVFTRCPDNLLLIGSIAPAVSGFMAVYTLAFVVRQIRKDSNLAGAGKR